MTIKTPQADPVRAKMFADVGHTGQMYNDDIPYVAHLQMVVDVLIRYGYTDPEMISAAYCHDLLEDSNRSYNDLKSNFGEGVAELVYAVTSELGRNRKERNEKTYPKLRGNHRATILKLADRIANVEYGAANGGKNDMYAKEFPGFKAALYQDFQDPAIDRMWKHLEKLLS